MKRSGATWPFHTWDRAESVVLNWAPYGPKSSLRVYDDNGWTKDVKYRAPLDAAAAKRSVALVLEQHGELLVSKCAVPRHAVVLYDGDAPVASINVCFSCQDILLWPQWPAKPTETEMKKAGAAADLAIPKWRKLFVDELHFPLWTDGP